MSENVRDHNQKSETETVSVPNTTGEEEGGGKGRGRLPAPKSRFPRRKFPANTLEDALRIASAIRDLNAGRPWPPSEVAKALQLSPKTNDFYALTASSRDYGLTVGTRNHKVIELAPIGHQCMYPTSEKEERSGLESAFFLVPLFKTVFEYYSAKEGELPETKYLQNTLRSQFSLPEEEHEDFISVYKENLQFLQRKGVTLSGVPSVTKGISQALPRAVPSGPKAGTKLKAFVAMPFTEKTGAYHQGFFNEVFTNLISPAADGAGFAVQTARREGSDVIQSTIVNDLLEADLVIVDLTEHNPNVLFELGVRMAVEKPIALIRSKGTPAIFDVDNLLRVLDYDPRLWKSTLEADLSRMQTHIRGSWENRESGTSYMGILRTRNK